MVGGGNSGGPGGGISSQRQHIRVHIMVRSEGLADPMSHYLIRRIQELPQYHFAHSSHADQAIWKAKMSWSM